MAKNCRRVRDVKRNVKLAGEGGLPGRVSLGAAVFVALYGVLPHSARAQQQTESPSSALQEITVTATRRQQVLEQVPYSLEVVSADQLARTGVTDIASLVNQVPGLSMYQFGAASGGSVFPIIRGLNASASS